MKAMILAAGLGTRLKGETKYKSKAMVEIGGKSLLQIAIEKIKSSGITEIVINVHHFSENIITWLNNNNFGVQIYISDETELLLDTGGALKKASSFLRDSESILIYNVDILSDLDINLVKRKHLKSGALATLVVRDRNTSRYFMFDEQQRLVGWTNKTSNEIKISRPVKPEITTEMAFSGIHIVRADIFDLMPKEEKFSITDFYLKLAENYEIKGYYDDSNLWMDVGKPEELAKARKLFQV